MPASPICSEARRSRWWSPVPAWVGARPRAFHGWLVPLAVLSTALIASVVPASAQGTITQAEALSLAFPGASSIERRTAFLDERQLAAARAAAGTGIRIEQPVVTYYVGKSGTRSVGVAYFDSHRVRTMPEVAMIVVAPNGTVQRIEILSFAEPPEYRPPGAWLKLFQGKALSPGLLVRRDIRNLSGATLTSRAVTEATRRVLALHNVIAPFSAPPGETR